MQALPTGIECPKCGREVLLRGGASAAPLLTSVRLRAGSQGVQFHCEACGEHFVHRFTAPPPDGSAALSRDAERRAS